MTAHVTSGSRVGRPGRRFVPAYGPIDAVIGFALFYYVLDRATPTVVEVLSDAFPLVGPSAYRLVLASFLWFVLAVTVFDQTRRQLVALGVLSDDQSGRQWLPPEWVPAVPSLTHLAGYLVLLLVGGTLAVLTFDRAVDTVMEMIGVVATMDVAAFVRVDFFTMVVFFVAFGVATFALDRAVIGGIRVLLYD